MERAGRTAPTAVAAPVGAVPSFHPHEIGKNIAVGPAGGTRRFPPVEIHRVASNVNHAVDGRRPAHDFAAGACKLAPSQPRFRLGCESPIVPPHVHRIGQGGGHLDERAEIRNSAFQNQHRSLRVFRQARCDRGTGAAGSDYDEVGFMH